jgi:hypothetical protein
MVYREAKVASIVARHGLEAALVVTPDGATLSSTGDPTDAAYASLLSALIGPYGNAKTTFDSLAGEPLAKMLGQGEHIAVVDRLSPDAMVIFLGRSRSPTDSYELCVSVSAAVRQGG